MANVSLNWKNIEWNPSGDTWKKKIVPKLLEVGFPKNEEALSIRLKRSVYVIRLSGYFAVNYPNGISPTIYIGEGDFQQRITSHRDWVRELEELAAVGGFVVKICTPRVRNNPGIYRAVEADLITRFERIYGAIPLRNRQREINNVEHRYKTREITSSLRLPTNHEFIWAIEPMPRNDLYGAFHR